MAGCFRLALAVMSIAALPSSVRSLLERQGISVVGAAANSAEALRCQVQLSQDAAQMLLHRAFGDPNPL